MENAAAKTTKQTTAPIHLNAWDAAKHIQHGTTHATNKTRRVIDKEHEEKMTRDSTKNDQRQQQQQQQRNEHDSIPTI